MHQFYKHKPKKCPNCKHTPVARILRGMPLFTEKFAKALDEGRLVIGGCEVNSDRPLPEWKCVNCNCEFFKKA